MHYQDSKEGEDSQQSQLVMPTVVEMLGICYG